MSNGSNGRDAVGMAEYGNVLTHLLAIGSALGKRPQERQQQLKEEITRLTGKKVELHIYCKGNSSILQLSQVDTISFSVQYAHRTYGVLKVIREVESPYLPFPLDTAHQLAHICGWLLYTWEITTLFQRQHIGVERQTYSPLTEQERIVLLHVCHGKTKAKIAQALSISPRTVEKHRQNLYQKLDVHNEREALLVAYQQNLFSPFFLLRR